MKKIFISLYVLLVLLSCQQDVVQEIATNDLPPDIIANVESAGFETEGLRKFTFQDQDGFLVENDIFLTAAQIDALAEEALSKGTGRSKHYRTYNLVTGAPRTLTVYMDPVFDTYMQNAFETALVRYNNESLSLTFQRSYSTSADIRFFAVNWGNNGVLGSSGGFPSGGNPANTILLNTYYYNSSTQRPDASTTIAHEIGHAIGFRHTDYMNRAYSCFTGGNEGAGGDGAVHIPNTPTTPSAASWMLACSSNTDRPFTGEDKAALCALYGHPNEEIVIIRNDLWNGVDATTGNRTTVVCVGWPDPEVMSSTQGYIYTVQGGDFWKTDPVSGATWSLGAGWNGSEAMGAVAGYIYTIQGGELWKTYGNDGNTWSLGGGWPGTEALAAGTVGGTPYVFAVQGGELWKTNGNTGASISLGAGWSGTQAMAFGSGYAFAVHGDQLYRVNATTGSVELIEGSGWSGTEAMTFYNGYVYAVQGGTLWRTNIGGGSASLGSGWSGTQVMTGIQ